MGNTFYLEIITPDRRFFSGDVETVILRTPEGEIGILKNHMPIVVAVDIGPVRIKKDGDWLEAVLTEGFMEVAGNKAVILVDTAEWPAEIDLNRANAAKERAQERLHSKIAHIEYARSQAALTRALMRIKMKKTGK